MMGNENADGVVLPKLNPPLCPHCGAQMTEALELFFWMVSGWLVSTASCPTCRKILATQLMPMDPGPSADPARIHMPS
jgi:hypothetical protein